MRQTYIALGQQLGAELHVVLEVEGAADFELVAEGRDDSGFREFLHAPYTPELPVGVLGYGEPRRPSVAAVVVVSRRRRRSRRLVVSVLVVLRHGYGIL